MLVEDEPKVKAPSHYSLSKAAELIGLSKRTIERKIESKDIKSIIKVADNKRYITGLEILKFWNKNY